MRNVHADTIAALSTNSFGMATLVQLDFALPIRITDYGRNITALSSTFISSANFLDLGAATETSDIRINSLTLTLSAAEQTYVALFLTNQYMDVRARIWRAVLDGSASVIGDPIMLFDGRIVNYSIADSETESEITIEIASHWKDFELARGRRTNGNSQKLFFANDRGFDFAPQTINDIKWGRE